MALLAWHSRFRTADCSHDLQLEHKGCAQPKVALERAANKALGRMMVLPAAVARKQMGSHRMAERIAYHSTLEGAVRSKARNGCRLRPSHCSHQLRRIRTDKLGQVRPSHFEPWLLEHTWLRAEGKVVQVLEISYEIL